jgi:hypothetical protein
MSVRGFESDLKQGQGGLADESRRRREATLTGGASTLDDPTDYSRPFLADDQRVFLWNTANLNLRPRSLKPCFRLLGLFASVDDASAHGARIVAADPRSSCSLRISSTHAWYTIPVDMITDLTPHIEKVNRNLETHKRLIEETTEEFLHHKQELTQDRKPASLDHLQAALMGQCDNDAPTGGGVEDDGGVEESKECTEIGGVEESKECLEIGGVEESKECTEIGDFSRLEPCATEKTSILPLLSAVNTCPENDDECWAEKSHELQVGGVPVPPIVREADVRNQKYAVVSVMQDYEALLAKSRNIEPGVCVWAAFDTESEALLYCKKVASKELKEHDLAIITMYEWAYPHLISSDKVPQLYRNVELNNIMKHARTSRTQVAVFEKGFEEKGMEIPAMNIEPDLTEPAPRIFNAVVE